MKQIKNKYLRQVIDAMSSLKLSILCVKFLSSFSLNVHPEINIIIKKSNVFNLSIFKFIYYW